MIDVEKWALMDPVELNRLYGKSQYDPNVCQDWCSTDTEDLFDKNMKDPAATSKLKDLGWTKNSILYRFNNHGFRTPDDWEISDPGEGNMFLGCSVTIGIGLNIEDTWGYRISSMLGGNFYNLSQAGTGIETQYRLLKSWGPLLKPKRIFTIGSFEPRREFLEDQGGSMIYSARTAGSDTHGIGRFICSDRDIGFSMIRTIDAMRCVALSIGAELWYPGFHNILEAHKVPGAVKTARDLIHTGKNFHSSLSDSLKKWTRLA